MLVLESKGDDSEKEKVGEKDREFNCKLLRRGISHTHTHKKKICIYSVYHDRNSHRHNVFWYSLTVSLVLVIKQQMMIYSSGKRANSNEGKTREKRKQKDKSKYVQL